MPLNAGFLTVRIDPELARVNVGDRLLVSCRATASGGSRPTVRWLSTPPGARLFPQSANEVSLRFDGVSPADSGQFVCLAEGGPGGATARATFTINVRQSELIKGEFLGGNGIFLNVTARN